MARRFNILLCPLNMDVILVVAILASQSGCAFVSAAFGNTGSAHNALQPAGSPPPPPPPPLPPLGRNEPYFDPMTPRNVTALVGKSAYLSCRVRNLGNKTVSWVRHRDIHILTVGGYTYTSDQRFQAIHHRDNDEWTLQIKWAQKRDAGMYECQISTQPHRSYFVTLNVVDGYVRESPFIPPPPPPTRPLPVNIKPPYDDIHLMFRDPVQGHLCSSMSCYRVQLPTNMFCSN